MPIRWNALWKRGALRYDGGPVHVSMNDYLIPRWRDAWRVALTGLKLRRDWPQTGGSYGLWMGALRLGRRQVSVSVWRSAEDLRQFVRSPVHVKIMRDFKGAGVLHTNAWTAETLDPDLIWRQARDRLEGRVAGVAHH